MAARCASCRYPLSVSDSVVCYECSSYFHIDCAQLVGFPHYELSGDPNKNTFRCTTCVLLPLPTRECDSDSGSDCDMPSRQEDFDIAKDMSEVKGAVQDLSNLCKDMLREINDIKSINLTLRCGIENLRHENEERDKLIEELKKRLDSLENRKKTVDNQTDKSNLCDNDLEKTIEVFDVTKVTDNFIKTDQSAQERLEDVVETTYQEHEEVIKSEVKSLFTSESKESRQDWTWIGKKAVELDENTTDDVEEEEGVTEGSEVGEEIAHGYETLQEELESQYNVNQTIVETSINDKIDSFHVQSDEELLHSEYETEDESLIEKELYTDEEITCSEKEDISERETNPLLKASNYVSSSDKQIEEEEEELDQQNLSYIENINSFQKQLEIEEREIEEPEVEDEEVENEEVEDREVKDEEDVTPSTHNQETATQDQAFTTEYSSNYEEGISSVSEVQLNKIQNEIVHTEDIFDSKTTEALQLEACDSCEEDEEVTYGNETISTLKDIRQDDFIEVEVGEIPEGEEGDNEESILREDIKDVDNTEEEEEEDGYRSELDVDKKEEAYDEEDGSHQNGEQLLEDRLEGDEGEERLGNPNHEVTEGETGVEGEQRLGGQSLEDGEVQPSEPPPTPPPQHTEEDLWHYLKEAVTSEHPSTVEEFLQNLIGTLQHVPEEYLQPVVEANIKRATSPTASADGEPLHTFEEPIEKQEAVPVEGASVSEGDAEPPTEEIAAVEEVSPEESSQFTEESPSGDNDGYSAVEAAA